MGNMLDHCCEERCLKKEYERRSEKQSFYNGYTIKPVSHYPGSGHYSKRKYIDNSSSNETDHDKFNSESGDEMLYEC